MLRLKIKTYSKLSLGEYGRQRTSTKFHDLVLNLKFQNSRVLETDLFLALFSQRKVSIFSWFILKIENHCCSFLETLYLFYFKIVSPHSEHFQVWKCFFRQKKHLAKLLDASGINRFYLFKRLEPYPRILSNVGVVGCRRFGLVCRLRGIHRLLWRWRGWLLGGQIPSRG